MAASVLEDMAKSVQLLSGLPDQSDRLNVLQQSKQELEGQLSPKLQQSLRTQNSSQLLSLYKIYCSLHIQSTFIDSYCAFHSSSFAEYYSSPVLSSVWKSSQVESPIETLQNFYSNLHTSLLSLSESIIAIFNEQEESTYTSYSHIQMYWCS